MNNISYFNNGFEKYSSKTLSISQFLQQIKQGTYVKEIENYRKKEIEKIKLPCVTISGEFKIRKAEELIKHSNLLAIDIDNTIDCLDVICADIYTYACFKTVSGNGLCVIVKIDGSKHLESFYAIEKYYQHNFNITIDKSCKDLSRLRFVSHDPDIFINEQAMYFFLEYAPIIKNDNDLIGNFIQKLISAEKGERHNTILKYSRALGGYIASGEVNEQQCRSRVVSAIESKINNISERKDFIKAFEDGISFGKQSPIGSSSIYENVFKLYKKGQKFDGKAIYEFSNSYNIKSTDVTHVVKQIEDNNKEYENIDNLTPYEKFSVIFNKEFDVIFNVITNVYYYKHKGSDEFIEYEENKVYNWFKMSKLKISKTDVTPIVISSAKDVNVFLNYFEDLKNYRNYHKSNDSYISKLLSYVPLKDESERPMFIVMFTKHLVRCIRNVYEGAENRYIFGLVDIKQDTGKTTFIRFLNPFKEDYICEESIDSNKDPRIASTSNYIYNIDEVDAMKDEEIAFLKKVLSTKFVNLRRPYAKQAYKIPRRCNFFCSTNRTDFLTDIENSRWILIDTNGDFKRSYKQDIDINNVWREALDLYTSGYDVELTREEKNWQVMKNKQFTRVNLEYTYIAACFNIPKSEEDSEFRTNAYIYKTLCEKLPASLTVYARNISIEMLRLGFKPDRKKIGGTIHRGFWIKEKNINEVDEFGILNYKEKFPFGF